MIVKQNLQFLSNNICHTVDINHEHIHKYEKKENMDIINSSKCSLEYFQHPKSLVKFYIM